jgi:WD40 repeat protein
MDYKIRIWDTVTRQQISGFEDHEAEAIGVQFDRTGTLLASTSWDSTCRLWNPGAARALLRAVGGGNRFRLAGDGSRLAYSTWDHSTVHLCEVTAGREVVSLERFPMIYSAAFSPDGAFLAATSADGLKVWQLPMFSPIATVRSASVIGPFFPSGRSVLLTCSSTRVQEWSWGCTAGAKEGAIGPARTLFALPGARLQQMASSLDGEHLVVAAGNDFWIIQRSGESRPVRLSDRRRPRHMAMAPDGRWIGGVLSDGALIVWDAQSLNVVTNFGPLSARLCQFSPDGRWLAAGSYNDYRLWTTKSWEAAPAITNDVKLSRAPAVAFSPQGHVLALRATDKRLRLLDLKTRGELASIPIELTTTSFAFSPDGGRLAVTTEKLGVQVWDLRRIRSTLAAMKLDWPASPIPGTDGVTVEAPALHVRVVEQGSRPTNSNPALAARLPQRGDASNWPAGMTALDLVPYFNAILADGWIPPFTLGATAEHTLPIPTGRGTFAGTPFQVQGAVQLASSVLTGRGGRFPARAEAIPVNRPCRRLHFLQGADWFVPDGTTIGYYVMRYFNGEDTFVPIVAGRHVYDWWREPTLARDTNSLTLAWTGANPASRRQGTSIHLYKMTWENPRWDLDVATVDFVSAGTQSGPFLIAITAE